MSSYKKINYSLRPAKNIERKMLCDAIAKLGHFQRLSKYRYIGFGSPYFSDFYLMHKRFGIKNLISIEKDKHNQDRFLFNKPFSCIKMEFDESHNVLPGLDWNKNPSIVWLDYDGKLDKNKLSDTNTFFSKAEGGSMFILSINSQPDALDPSTDNKKISEKGFRIDELAKRIGSKEKLPLDIEERTLSLSDNYKVLKDIIDTEIHDTLIVRNGGLSDDKKLIYKQIFYFTYSDNAKMLTIGGLLYSKSQEAIFKNIDFDDLEFVRDAQNKEAFDIDVPSLTFKEIHALDSLLPDKIDKKGKIKLKGDEKIKPPKLIDKDVFNYAKIYKYFPNFAEANF